jgi:hypothetical protein
VIKVTPLCRQRCSEPDGQAQDGFVANESQKQVASSPFFSSAASGQGDASLRRTLMLTELHDWCMSRLSKLSLAGENQLARALTAEHLELLEAVNHHQTLWMVIEVDG